MKAIAFLLTIAALALWGAHILRTPTPPIESVARQASSRPPQANAQSQTLTVRGVGDVQTPNAPPTPVAAPALFRPLTPPPTNEAPQSGETFTLVGIIMRDNQPIAYLRDDIGGQVHSGGLNAPIAQWRIAAIDNSCVEVQRRRERQRICVS